MNNVMMMLALGFLICGCGAKARATGQSRQVIHDSGVVDLEQLTTAETLVLIDIVTTEASPCEGELSLLASLESSQPCPASLRALGFIYRRILEGYGREDVLDQYVARFKQAETVKLDLDGCPDTGPSDAPVTITVFSDFNCPYCKKAAKILADVKEKFPDDVRVVFKHYPLANAHPDSMSAALASAAAHMQGQFWEMHDALFALDGDLSSSNIEDAAAQAGLDMERYEEDVESPDVLDIVSRDLKQAQSLALDGTPVVFVDGMRYTEPMKYLDQVVQERLVAGQWAVVQSDN